MKDRQDPRAPQVLRSSPCGRRAKAGADRTCDRPARTEPARWAVRHGDRPPNRAGARRRTPRSPSSAPESAHAPRVAREETPRGRRTARSWSRHRPTSTCRPRRERTERGLVPLSRRISARSANSFALTTRAPPSPHVKFFVSWKLRVASLAEGTQRPAGKSPEQAVGIVLHQPEVVPVGERAQGFHFASHAGIVNRNDRFRAVRDGVRHETFVEIQGVGSDVHEHGPGTAQRESICRRDEGERRHDHFVARREVEKKVLPSRGRRCTMWSGITLALPRCCDSCAWQRCVKVPLPEI